MEGLERNPIRGQEGALVPVQEGSEGKFRIRAMPRAWRQTFQFKTGVQKAPKKAI